MKNYVNLLFKKVILATFVCAFGLSSIAQEVEEVVVTAEKRSESLQDCLLYTSPSPRDMSASRMPSSA